MASLKIRSLELRNFRAFRRATVNCDADVVLIYGRNGVGKTTIFDAIEYALFGCSRRLEQLGNAWERYLPNVHGDGSFSIGLQFQTNERIEITRRINEQTEANWAGYPTVRDFIYERLMRNHTLGRRKVAAIHDLSLATHLLLQSEIAKLAASGTLDSEKLAALTGSGYLERCRDKAAQASEHLRKRREDARLLQSEIDSLQQQTLLQVQRLAQLLIHRDELVDELRQHAVRPIFAPELLDRIDERSAATELAAVSARLRESLREAERTAALARELIGAAINSRDDLVIREAVESLRSERQSVLTEKSALANQLALAREASDRHESEHAHIVGHRDGTAALLSDAVSLTDDLARLPGLIDASRMALEELGDAEASLKLAEAAATRATAELAESRSQETRLQAHADHLREAYERSRRTEREWRETDSLLKKAEETLTSATVAAESAARRAEQVRAVIDREQQIFATSAAEIDSLVGELRGVLSSESDCPLCGTAFGAVTALRRAIDAHAARRSEEHAAAQRRMEDQRKLRDEAVAMERAARSALDAALHGVSNARDQRDRAYSIRNAATVQLAALIPGEIGVEETVRSAAAQAEAGAKVVARKLHAVTEADSRVTSAREVVRSTRVRVRDITEIQKAVESGINALKERIAAAAQDYDTPIDEPSLRAALDAADVALHESEERREILIKRVRDSETRLKEVARRLIDIEARLTSEQQRLQEVERRREAHHRRLATLGLPPDATDAHLTAVMTTASTSAAQLRALADGTEELARIASSATASDLHNARLELRRVELRRESAEREISAIDEAQRTLMAWEETLRRRVDSAVQAFVIPREAEIAETFRSFIADPFRFDGVAIRHDSEAGLQLGLIFRNLVEPSGSPEFFLSAAQMSALALAIFLALARSQTWSNLDVILLDDPVQHLDDLDCVALLDGLRSVARRSRAKQLIISTCDRTLYHQMIRKFTLSSAPANATVIAMSLEEDLQNGVTVRYDIGGPGSKLSAAQ